VVVGGAEDEAGDEGDRRNERSEVARVAPIPVGPLDYPQGQQSDPEGQHRRAEQVGATVFGFADLVEDADGEDGGDDSDRNVDEEDPVPSELDQEAADGWAEGGGDAADRRPDGDQGIC
jgi:hypothetical protein